MSTRGRVCGTVIAGAALPTRQAAHAISMGLYERSLVLGVTSTTTAVIGSLLGGYTDGSPAPRYDDAAAAAFDFFDTARVAESHRHVDYLKVVKSKPAQQSTDKARQFHTG